MSKDLIYKEFEQNYEKTICDLTQHSPVYIVLSIPEIGLNVPNQMNRSILLHKKATHHVLPLHQYQTRTNQLTQIQKNIAQKCGATIIDPTSVLCKSGQCITQHHGRSLYKDGDHLNEYGNKLLTPLFKDVFK